MESLDEMILNELNSFADNFYDEMGVHEEREPFDIRILSLGEFGNFRIIFYGNEVVGSMLHYKDELVTFGYMKRGDLPAKKRFN